MALIPLTEYHTGGTMLIRTEGIVTIRDTRLPNRFQQADILQDDGGWGGVAAAPARARVAAEPRTNGTCIDFTGGVRQYVDETVPEILEILRLLPGTVLEVVEPAEDAA